jgi:murein DD-endopeptidase MepM/ murein hydrolase activator NlpD
VGWLRLRAGATGGLRRASAVIRVFPVAAEGHPTFADDFGTARPGGHKHQGNDIFAAEGTAIVAVDDGALRFAEDPLGGHAFYLTADDGTVYYGAHLAAYEGQSPRFATAGEVLGYVGHTGNAARTSAHLHFEVHPSGGVAVDPYRLLIGLTPQSVTSSLGAMGEVLPAPPPAVADPLPPIPSPKPVPPIPPRPADPTVRRSRSGRAFVLAIALVAGTVAFARKGAG